MQKLSLPQRKNIRLQGYNYSNNGYYFITICTKNREEILSKIINKNIIQTCRGGFPCPPETKYITKKRRGGFPCPPENRNTLQIVNTEIGNSIEKTIKYINNKYERTAIRNYIIMPNHIHLIIENAGGHGNPPLQKIITELKSYTTKTYNEINKAKYLKLWQRNYYEHIIRNEKEYINIVEYIYNNPIKWINKKHIYNEVER